MLQFSSLRGLPQLGIPLLPGWDFVNEPSGQTCGRTIHFTEVWSDNCELSIARTSLADPIRYRLEFADLITVEVIPDERRIVSRGQASEFPRPTFEHLIADQVVPRILAHEGQFVLHAAAVRHGDGAIVLIGESGSGKSTLAASFNRHDYGLLSDDALILSWSDGKPFVKPVYPSLRLLPDSMAALFPEAPPSEPMAHYGSKRRLSAPLDRLAPVGALPVSAMILLGSPAADGSIALRRLMAAEACMKLVANSFALDPADLSRAASRLDCASRLATARPACELSYPRDFARLAEVQAAIQAELA